MADSKLFKDGVAIYGDEFLVRVGRDRLEAIAVPRLEIPIDQINMEKFQVELHGVGIVFGLLPAFEDRGDGSYVVARGEPVRHGEDARIMLYVRPATFHPAQAQLDKDRMDFKELHNIVNVRADNVLAEKIPPTEGAPGRDVLGNIIPAKAGKDKALRGGAGVKVSGDGSRLLATIDGKFIMTDGKPAVMPEHVVMGDVDFSVGNIVFGGRSLIIHGEVLPGFSVKCRGDIEIRNGVNNAEVMAGGNLTVKHSIVGEESVIRVKGDIVADFIENGPQVECGGRLTVKGYILQAHVRTGLDLVVRGEGTIIGGSYAVGGSVYVKELGSNAGVQTDLTVGVNLGLLAKKEKLEEELTLWSGRLNDLLKNITGLEKQKKEEGNRFSAENMEKLRKYSTVMPRVMEKVDGLTEIQQELQAELDQMVDASVYVSGKIYPGVVLRIGNAIKGITAPEQDVAVYYDRPSRYIHLRKMTNEERRKMEQGA